MKIITQLALLACLAVSASFAQRPGHSAPPTTPPAQVRVPIHRQPPVVVRPYYYGGYSNYGYYGDPYWYGWRPYYSGTVVIGTPQPCKKETLKDSDGKKHDILVCRQPDGQFKVVADADQLKSAPAPTVVP